jgi:protein-tyrosine phosphatase
MISILYVCLGNICRSPIAEGTMKALIEKEKLSHKIKVDSAGTADYHIGDPPDRRTRANAQSHGIALNHACRQLVASDFAEFDYIVAMDEQNLQNINLLSLRTFGKHQPEENCFLLRKFDPQNGPISVPDPYYGTKDDFELVYQIVQRSNQAFLEHIIEKHQLK